ncbi:MAG TPA: fumarylacetoacetate hydrolase family protein [Albitalea sp.]|uniref:fumarylacetoacetate hydrolase family protein n=1 Tax=Piscinibacter sp. TaxID=1903157 RepID=UPI002ED51C05
MPSSSVQAVTDALLRARSARRPVPTAGLALADAGEAYAVQDAVASGLGWFPGMPRHWKSGGPSLVAIAHAPLPPAGVWTSPASAGDWPFVHRIVEAEVALRLGRDVDAATAALDAASLVDAMTVSIEIVDSRWAEATEAPPLLKLADVGLHGALVLGAWQPFQTRDWAAQPCRVRIGDRVVAEQRGGHSLGDPLAVLPEWLRHATRRGTVPAGTVVTTGAWIVVREVKAGDRVTAEFDGIGKTTVML